MIRYGQYCPVAKALERRPQAQFDLVALLRGGLDAGHLTVELDAPRTLP